MAAVEEAYLYSLSRDLLSAAVRLGILGPMHGNPQPPATTLQQPSSPARVIETARLSEPAALAKGTWWSVLRRRGGAAAAAGAAGVGAALRGGGAFARRQHRRPDRPLHRDATGMSRTNLSGVLLVFVGQKISRNLCACRGTTRCCTPDSSRAEVGFVWARS